MRQEKESQEIGIKQYFIEDERSDVLKQKPQNLKFLATVKFQQIH